MSEDIQIRAARAQQLLDDEVLNEAWGSLAEDVMNEALRASLSKPEECIAAIAFIQCSQAFREKLKSYVTAGKAAERKPFKVA